ncbi:PAAR domain-containing protein [bacterium]|nr:PAAR domain-containing protein [bacterium]MBU1754229.1 PAAR domain-containing protein [bacterium]
MGKPAARLGDPTMHDGTIIIGFPTVLIGGKPAARMGDMHVCPMVTPGTPPIPHVGGPITIGAATVLIGNMPAACMGDMATCIGPPDTIMMGCPTVLIGTAGGGGAGAAGAAAGAAAANFAAKTKSRGGLY